MKKNIDATVAVTINGETIEHTMSFTPPKEEREERKAFSWADHGILFTFFLFLVFLGAYIAGNITGEKHGKAFYEDQFEAAADEAASGFVEMAETYGWEVERGEAEAEEGEGAYVDIDLKIPCDEGTYIYDVEIFVDVAYVAYESGSIPYSLGQWEVALKTYSDGHDHTGENVVPEPKMISRPQIEHPLPREENLTHHKDPLPRKEDLTHREDSPRNPSEAE